jgi:heme-degrading monooxygenase HmoA
MFAVIYRFEVKKEKEAQFIQAWKELTELIYANEGSLGSRLHKKDEHTYLAYAQWPDKFTFENAGSNMPSSADRVRQKMRNACDTIETLHELEVIEDLLR